MGDGPTRQEHDDLKERVDNLELDLKEKLKENADAIGKLADITRDQGERLASLGAAKWGIPTIVAVASIGWTLAAALLFHI